MDASPDDPGPPAREAPSGSPLGRVPAKAPGAGLGILASMIAGFLVLAIVKPWDWGAASPPPVRVVRPAQTSPAPPATPDLTPEGLAAGVCLGTGAWRVATIETWRLVIAGELVTQRVRVWHAVEPVPAAAGPLDPGIPIVGIAGMEVNALGWCAPAAGAGRPAGPVDVTLWRLADPAHPGGSGRPEVVSVRRVAPAGGETPLAALYREVTDCVSGYACSGSAVPLLAPAWSPGRYVFEYAERGSGRTLWFGVDVQLLPVPSGPRT